MTRSQLTNADQQLAQSARKASFNAYAPYSGYAVGAAVRTKSGTIFTGANLENASYGVTMCAEVAAITAANSAGDFEIETIAVSGHKFLPPIITSEIVTPCGRCRQMILEASQVSGVDIRVLCCSGDLNEVRVSRISELLPLSFGPENLGLSNVWPKMREKLKMEFQESQALGANSALSS